MSMSSATLTRRASAVTTREGAGAKNTRLAVSFPVEFVHDAMHDRREEECSRCDEDEPRVQRVDACEHLASVRVRRVDGAHAARDHRGVEKGVAPGKPFEVLVARHSDRERHHDERRGAYGMAQHAADESSARDGRV